MRKRNQNGPGRKKSPQSSEGSDVRRESPRNQSFRKDTRSGTSGSRRSSGKTDKFSSSGSGNAKPFKRSGSGFKEPGSSTGSGYRSKRGDESTSFSRKSRFSQDPPQESPRSKSRPESAPRSGTGRRRDENSQREVRPESYGKPYKKVYKPKADRAGAKPLRRREENDVQAPKSDKIRLNKFIANSGVCSRREADELIKMGLISVNGSVVSELGYKVSPGDEVRYESKVLRAEKPVYVLMNKPKGFLTTTDDPQERKTVMHIIGSAVKERIYPVGRLDRNTTGLLLLTNDGDLADKLMHPSFNVKKIYKVELNKPLSKADFQTISEGVRLEEGRAVVDDLAIVSPDNRTIGIELHIGWNRVVRRIFESLGYEVEKLDRTVYAGLDKKDLARGQWRFLTKEEIIQLKHFK